MVMFEQPEGMRPSRKIYGAERGARWVSLMTVIFLVAKLVGMVIRPEAEAVPLSVFPILTGGLVALFPAQVAFQGGADVRGAKSKNKDLGAE